MRQNGRAGCYFQLYNKSVSPKSLAYMEIKAGSSGNHTILGHISETYAANDSPQDLQDYGIVSSDGNGLIINATKNDQSPGIIKFLSGQSSGTTMDERMRINMVGNIGIGTKEPKTLLDVNGGIKISNSTDQYAGMLRWTGSDFEGYNGSSWLSLTGGSSEAWQTNGNNIFYESGNVSIGTSKSGGYFNPKLNIRNGWLQVVDSSDNDAGIVISHLHRSGYGYARTLHSVFEGVNGDPYTEFRIRNTNDDLTVTSWAIGSDNSDNDKLIISNRVNTTTGASPSYGNKLLAIDTTVNAGIGTKKPTSKLEIADGDIYISDIDKGIIMKSPDGQCWRGTLDNNGSLNFSQISCPEINVQTNSTENVTTSAKISIFPNPTENSITIKNENNVKKLSYRMLSMNGQLLKSGNVRSNNMSVDISSFSAGMYIINILDKSGNKLVSEKLVKK